MTIFNATCCVNILRLLLAGASLSMWALMGIVGDRDNKYSCVYIPVSHYSRFLAIAMATHIAALILSVWQSNSMPNRYPVYFRKDSFALAYALHGIMIIIAIFADLVIFVATYCTNAELTTDPAKMQVDSATDI